MTTYALRQAVVALQRALADAPDEDGVVPDISAAGEDFDTLLEAVIQQSLEAQMMAEALTARIITMKERAQRYDTKADRLRNVAQGAMSAVGLRRFERPEFTASIKANAPKVHVYAEGALPHEFVRMKAEPDKAKIKTAIQSGLTVPGASLSNQPDSISIRTR